MSLLHDTRHHSYVGLLFFNAEQSRPSIGLYVLSFLDDNRYNSYVSWLLENNRNSFNRRVPFASRQSLPQLHVLILLSLFENIRINAHVFALFEVNRYCSHVLSLFENNRNHIYFSLCLETVITLARYYLILRAVKAVFTCLFCSKAIRA